MEKGGVRKQPKLTQSEKDLRRLSIGKFRELLAYYLNRSLEELQDIIKRPHTPAIDVLIISILIKAIKEADTNRANFFLDRLYGRPKASFEGMIGVGTPEEVGNASRGMPTVQEIETAIAADPFVKKAIEIRAEDYKNGVELPPEPKEPTPADMGLKIDNDPFA